MSVFGNEKARIAIRIVIAILLGLFGSMLYPSLSMSLGELSEPWLANIWSANIISLVVSLIISMLLMMALSRGKISTYGFKISGNLRLKRTILIGLGAGFILNVIGSFLPTGSNPAVADFSFFQVVIFIWIFASLYEEVISRGLVQSFLSPLMKYGFTVFELRISLPVLIGALFFASIHLALLTLGTDPLLVIITVLFAFVLGIIAGYFREITGSLVPAIIVHMLFNISANLADSLTGLFR